MMQRGGAERRGGTNTGRQGRETDRGVQTCLVGCIATRYRARGLGNWRQIDEVLSRNNPTYHTSLHHTSRDSTLYTKLHCTILFSHLLSFSSAALLALISSIIDKWKLCTLRITSHSIKLCCAVLWCDATRCKDLIWFDATHTSSAVMSIQFKSTRVLSTQFKWSDRTEWRVEIIDS